jgi:hypothetical protein
MMNAADAFALALCGTFLGTLAIALVYAMRLLGLGC